jgi:RHH-type proline utilization regulon transcriptional repressor/proline dehydrogenase/delta 1-pyrroline-5-carboxylate dehydrogenase
MMNWSMRDEHFKVQMFRFVDVLASLRRSGDIVRHLREYFADMRDGFAPIMKVGLRAAGIVPSVTSFVLRRNVSGMARQFIAGRNPDDVMKTLHKRRSQNIGFTVDLLGEAVVSEPEADEYAARCLELLEGLAEQTRGWTDPLGAASDLFPVVNLSVKISALYSQMNPIQLTRSRTLSRSCGRFYVARESLTPSSISTWKATRTRIPRSSFSKLCSAKRNSSIGRMPASSSRLTSAMPNATCAN